MALLVNQKILKGISLTTSEGHWVNDTPSTNVTAKGESSLFRQREGTLYQIWGEGQCPPQD
jgi:hypothetical protein